MMMSVLEQSRPSKSTTTRLDGQGQLSATQARTTHPEQTHNASQEKRKRRSGRAGLETGTGEKERQSCHRPVGKKERQRDSRVPGWRGVWEKRMKRSRWRACCGWSCCTVSCPAAPPSSIAGIRIGMGDWGRDASPTAPFGRGQRSSQRASDWRLPGCRAHVAARRRRVQVAGCRSRVVGRGSRVCRSQVAVAGCRLQEQAARDDASASGAVHGAGKTRGAARAGSLWGRGGGGGGGSRDIRRSEGNGGERWATARDKMEELSSPSNKIRPHSIGQNRDRKGRRAQARPQPQLPEEQEQEQERSCLPEQEPEGAGAGVAAASC